MKEKYLKGISVWAFSIGCIIGWGSFVMPGTTFLPKADPVGTTVGVIISAVMGFVICGNYSKLVRSFPDEHSSYSYTRKVIGEDHAFLSAWSLELAYISLLWANATAFVLIGRYVISDIFRWGFHYSIAGYDVYLGEVITTVVVLLFFGSLTTFLKSSPILYARSAVF